MRFLHVFLKVRARSLAFWALGVLVLDPNVLPAQTTWTGGTANWFDAAQWDNGVPISNEARMLNFGQAQINAGVATASSLTLGPDTGTQGYVKINAGSLDVAGNISLGSNGVGIFDVVNGGTLKAASITLAPLAGEGYLDVTNSTLVTQSISRGTGLTASFDLRNSTLKAGGNSTIFLSGFNAPEVNFYQADTIDTNGFNVRISSPIGGTGSLTKTGQGVLTMTGIYTYSGTDVAFNGTVVSEGILRLTGSGASISHGTRDFIVSEASMEILAGASVTNNAAAVNGTLASPGTFLVDGAGSSWTSSGPVFVGSTGSGEVEIRNGAGGQMNSNLFIADQAGSVGKVTVSAATLNVGASGIFAGNKGAGTMDIVAGSVVTSTNGTIGTVAGSNGTVDIADAGSQWNIGGLLAVGSLGTGTLKISQGAVVTNGGNGQVAISGSSTGTVTVAGAGSRWNNGGDISLGKGSITVSNGGAISGTSGFIGTRSGQTGTLTVTGAGSKADFGSLIAVGNGGIGSLQALAGGKITSAGNSSVNNASSVLISGSGSSWINAGDLAVNTASTLTVANGGLLQNTRSFVVNGTVNVSGSGSVWRNTSDAALGQGSGNEGILTLSDGGVLRVDAGATPGAGTLFLGYGGGGSGTLNIGAALDQAAAAAGTVQTAIVASGFDAADSATINFNHTDSDYVFAAQLLRNVDIVHQAGVTTLTGNSNQTGLTNVTGGTLVIGSSTALGQSDIFVDDSMGLGATLEIKAGVSVVNASAGPVTIEFGGTLVVNGSLDGGALPITVLAPGGIGNVMNNGTITSSAVAITSNPSGKLAVFNTGTIQGTAAAIFTNDEVNVTNSGLIKGTGATAIGTAGGGTVTNLAGGHIDGTGGFLGAILSTGGPFNLSNAGLISGSVQLAPAEVNTVTLLTGGVINGGVTIGTQAGSKIILDGSGSESYSSAVTGATIMTTGSLVKQGTGTWNLDQAFTYTGNTVVNAGLLAINGSVAGNVQVNGGTLGGNGSIGGSLFNNGGLINVGNSPGIMNVAGSFVQGPNGTFMVEAAGASPGQFDQLNVGTNATLNGGLVLQILPGYVPQIGTVFNFLTVGGTISGQFSSLSTNLNGSLKASVVYDAKGLPSIVISQGLFQTFALTPNQRSVAANIDSFSSTGQSPGLVNLLNSLPGSALPGAYDQISPDEYGSMSRPILAYNATQQSNLQRRFADLRAGSTGFSANGFTLLGFDRSLLLAGGGDAMAAQIASDPDKSPMRIAKDNKWGFFVNGSGQFGDVNSDGNGVGYDFTTGGINLGLDYRISDSVVVGGSLGYANSSTDTDAAGGSIQANNAKALLYSSWFKKGFYVNGAVGGGGTSYDTKRNVLGSRVSGSTSGGDFTTFLGGGYDFKVGALTIGPAASLEYSFVNVAGFTERGGIAPLQIMDQNFDSLRSRLGLLAAYPFELAGIKINPTLNVAWQHEFLDTDQTVSSRFANGSGGIFGVQSAEAERESAIVGLGVDVAWTPAISTYLSYDSEAAERYLSQSVSGGVKFKF